MDKEQHVKETHEKFNELSTYFKEKAKKERNEICLVNITNELENACNEFVKQDSIQNNPKQQTPSVKMDADEIWKPIPDERFINYLKISNKYRVKSVPRVVVGDNGKTRLTKERILKIYTSKGRKYVFTTINGKKEKIFLSDFSYIFKETGMLLNSKQDKKEEKSIVVENNTVLNDSVNVKNKKVKTRNTVKSVKQKHVLPNVFTQRLMDIANNLEIIAPMEVKNRLIAMANEEVKVLSVDTIRNSINSVLDSFIEKKQTIKPNNVKKEDKEGFVWKVISGTDKKYEICEDGRVRRKLVKGNYRLVRGYDKGDYRVEIRRYGRRYYALRAELLIEVFEGQKVDKKAIKYKDGNPLNWRLDNLVW